MKKVHNVFLVSRLKRFHRLEGEKGSFSVVIDTEGNIEQEVITILNKKKENRRVFYLVQFEGDSVEDTVWIKKTDLDNCKGCIRKFENSLRTTSSKRG